MNDFDDRIRKLDQLKQQNADRLARLRQLASQWSNNNDDSSETDAILQRELKLMPTLDEPNLEPDPTIFRQEVVETHGELLQVKAVLEERLEHDKSLLAVQRRLLEESQEVDTILVTRRDRANQESSILQSKYDPLEESRWLNDELNYLTAVLDEDSANDLWSLATLLHELIQRYMDYPSDPYLLISVLPIHPRHVALLLRCQIIENHEDNPELIRLTDYLEGFEQFDVPSR